MPRKRSPARPEVFLSHSSKNVAFVNRLVKVLGSHRVSVFLSKANIKGAQQWHDEIGTALRRCNWFLVVLSPESVRSRWVKHQLMYALEENRCKERIIPVLYKTCDTDNLSWTLSAIEWVDFRKDFDKACEQLFRIWQIRYKPA
jgi:TIR domain